MPSEAIISFDFVSAPTQQDETVEVNCIHGIYWSTLHLPRILYQRLCIQILLLGIFTWNIRRMWKHGVCRSFGFHQDAHPPGSRFFLPYFIKKGDFMPYSFIHVLHLIQCQWIKIAKIIKKEYVSCVPNCVSGASCYSRSLYIPCLCIETGLYIHVQTNFAWWSGLYWSTRIKSSKI